MKGDSEKIKEHAKTVYSGKKLTCFNAVADLGMFPTEMIKAQNALMNGDLDLNGLSEVVDKTAKMLPQYFALYPELDELFSQNSALRKLKEFVLSLDEEKDYAYDVCD